MSNNYQDSCWFLFRRFLGRHIGNRWIQIVIALKTDYQFEKIYGDFHFGKSYRKKSVEGLKQESGKVYGGIIKFIESISNQQDIILLPGENSSVKFVYSNLFNLPQEKIITTGIMDDMDLYWDFNDSPQTDQKYSCIISQSMLEHLINPYKHISDCANLLKPNGHMIIHTMMPGFDYHRHPIDCLRFYPDWFEVVSERLGLEVTDKYIHNSRITYMLKKPG